MSDTKIKAQMLADHLDEVSPWLVLELQHDERQQITAELRRLDAVVDGLNRLHVTRVQENSEQLRQILALTAERDALREEVERLRASPAPVAQGEPVAVIGSGYQLLWASGEPLADTVKRTGIKAGSVLYANAAPAPVLTPAQPLTDEQLDRAVAAWFEGVAPPNDAGPKFRARMRAAINATGQEGGKA